MSSRSLTTPPYRVLKIIVFLGCVQRIAAIAWRNPLDWLVSDGMRHWENGAMLWQPGVTQVFDPLLYQVWLAFFQAFSGTWRFGVVVQTSILSLALPYFWYLFARRIFPKGPLALLSCAIICWMPTLTFNYCYFMNEALFLPLLGAALWLTTRFLSESSLRNILFCAIGWALAMHTRTVAVPAGILSILFCCITRRRYSYIVPALAIIALSCAPQLVRAHKVLNFYYPFATSPFNESYFVSGAKVIRFDVKDRGTWEFSSPSFYYDTFSPFSKWQSSRHHLTEMKIDLQKGRADWDAEYKRLSSEHLNLLPGLIVENSIFLLFGHSWPESHQDDWMGLLCLWSRWIWPPLIIFALFAAIGHMLYRRVEYLPFITSALILLLLCQPFGVAEGRYRKPIEPLVIIATIYFLNSMRKGRAGKPEVIATDAFSAHIAEPTGCKTVTEPATL